MSEHQPALFETTPDPWELDDAELARVADVVFTEAPWGPYSYLVPDRLTAEVEPGRRVRVPLGRGNRAVVGWCTRVETRPAGRHKLKPVAAVVDARPLIGPAMLSLTEWIADYYLCPWGQSLSSVVPAGVRSQAGTREQLFLQISPEGLRALAAGEPPPRQQAILRVASKAGEPQLPEVLARIAGGSLSTVQTLRKKGMLHAVRRRVQSVPAPASQPSPREPNLELHVEQRAALAAILQPLEQQRHATLLLHGVTGSGKTEVYIQAIERVRAFGRQAVMLVPEISLTPQTCARFRSRFERVAVLHSHLSDVERHRQWREIAAGRVDVIVGARSAVFSPAPQLGLIVIDEEHDASFKQDQAPRYHARDVARRLAEQLQIPLVLGSATPSLEVWQAVLEGEVARLPLPTRVLGRPLPEVAAIDLRTEFTSRAQRGAVSRQLELAIRRALQDGGQVILLLNRRGYATHIQCPGCGHTVTCPDCDIALTHHREEDLAICHWCDHRIPAPHRCPECGFAGIRFAGLGTQRLEAEIKSRFPGAPCLRMDSDSMSKPGSHEKALTAFREGKVRILLGTQMIAKGLDFPQVTLVGVINADTALHLPDFRAAERTFQLVTQVAGRTGRGDLGGRVLVQTFSPEHPALVAAMRHDFEGFAAGELPARKAHGYPPYAHLVRFVVRGPQEKLTESFAEQLAEAISTTAERQGLPIRLLGPAPAPVARLRGLYRFHMLLYGTAGPERNACLRAATEGLIPPEETQWIADVDAFDML